MNTQRNGSGNALKENGNERQLSPPKNYSARRLIDTSDEKFQNSPGLQRWAAIKNLKIAAQSYNEVGSLAEIIKYAQQYNDNRSYHIGYKKAKNPDAYFRRYENQTILYGGARLLTNILKIIMWMARRILF